MHCTKLLNDNLQCLPFPEICWILRERQPPKLPFWSLSAMLERQFLPVPCWVLLSSLSFCYWLSHLLRCCPWKNISLQEPPAALNSKGYNDSAAWSSISFSTFCICQLLTSSRSCIVRVLKKGAARFSPQPLCEGCQARFDPGNQLIQWGAMTRQAGQRRIQV